MSDPQEATGFLSTSTENSITISKITKVGKSAADPGTSGDFDSRTDITVSIEGTTESKTGKLPVTFDGLTPDKEYKIKVVIPDVMGDIVLEKKVRTTEGSINDVTAPDLTGFNENTTYYATFDTVGGTIGSKITTKADTLVSDRKIAAVPPSGWYDYSNNKWANIVTMKDSGEAAYFTWVPRYEYKINEELNSVDVVYITANRTTPDDGYKIPDAFTFNGKALSGIWVGKYEITKVALPVGFNTTSIDGGFKIESVVYDTTCTKSGMVESGKMVIKNGSGTVKTINSIGVGGTVDGLPSGTYTVEWTLPLSYKQADGKTDTYKTITSQVAVRSSVSPEVPDLSGFYHDRNTSNVYYVTYTGDLNNPESMLVGDKVEFDASGNASNIPTGWYDYASKKWANIVVSNKTLTKGDKINSLSKVIDMTMWVWIPRYEYKIDGSVSAVFVGKDDSADSGFKIPDAFKFNNENLSGIWVGKYEIEDQLSSRK